MSANARTPEELEALLEDALLLGDREEVARLFERRGLLVMGPGAEPARGTDAIKEAAASFWGAGRAYVAGHSRIVQARDTGLVLSSAAINVVRRDRDGAWRYAIALFDATKAKGRADA